MVIDFLHFMFELIPFLWFIRTTKTILFWLYLWQLKEYHIGRFLDHFRTEKGKKLLFTPLNYLKILSPGHSFLFYYSLSSSYSFFLFYSFSSSYSFLFYSFYSLLFYFSSILVSQ